MRRRIFNILAAISLVLCLATAGSWIRSEFRVDAVSCSYSENGQKRQVFQGLSVALGSLCYGRKIRDASKPMFPPTPHGQWTIESRPAPSHREMADQLRSHGFYRLGFINVHVSGTFAADTWTERVKYDWIGVPHWFLMLLLSIAPARWAFVKRRQLHRRRCGLCVNCGYDLRATPEAAGPLLDRCPECGSKVRASALTR